MKRFHVHVSVAELNQYIQFYSTLFGAQPSKQKAVYAKWMLEDPKVNFAISTFGDITTYGHSAEETHIESNAIAAAPVATTSCCA